MTLSERIAANTRLTLLKALAEQPDLTLNDALLSEAAWVYGGHRRSRDQIRSEMRWLEGMDAIKCREAGTALIATLTQRGLDHLERRQFLEGVDRPRLEA